MSEFIHNLISTIVAFVMTSGAFLIIAILLRSAIFWRWEPYPQQWGILFRGFVIVVFVIDFIWSYNMEPNSTK